ncbi:MAG: hypothetical protein CM15mL1_0060 [Libanvirus sp.]|jgi:hypothetical protein|nr:MAG: hypothetical protein CM15mL1_0060 [Libanvirus sp.]|tara:strand:- start:501 stop:728 length:228 start_codon:yes stop_codon:yes gene_type:complete
MIPSMRKTILNALKAHAMGDIKKHLANIEIYLENPAGIGEHSDVMEAIQVELDQVAKYHDQLEVIKNYIDRESSS